MNNILALDSINIFKTTRFQYFDILKPIASILIFILFISYIFQINFESSQRYLIREQERKVTELLTETKGLEMTLGQKGSLASLMPILQEMNFQEPDKILYIQIFDQQVAIK
ncbi:MAG: hypothetical protein PHN37_00980 [Candidatus Pacebacteria bacterium]|nr:hypothetical protein [Candidatus Paceibacterota bacterium]